MLLIIHKNKQKGGNNQHFAKFVQFLN